MRPANTSTLGLVGLFWLVVAIQWRLTHASYGVAAGSWKISYTNDAPIQHLEVCKCTQYLNVTIYDVDLSQTEYFFFEVHIDETRVIVPQQAYHIAKDEFSTGDPTAARWQGAVPVVARHYGYAELYVILIPNVGEIERSPQTLDIAVTHIDRVDERILTYTAGVLVLLMFINLGTVLDLERLKGIVLRPIGPAIAVVTTYLLMPALALGLGFLCLRDQRELQLALFYTSLAPSGGLANICNIFLRGNINLGIASTTINSLLALGMLPLWIFMLARVVFDDSSLTVPFVSLAMSAVAIIVAVSVGLALRLLIPKTTLYIFRFLKPLSVFLSLCQIGVMVGINAFAFKELTLMISVAAILLPILGYLLAFGACKLLRRTNTDSLTIAIETSVLNMTVPIVLMQASLDDTQVDMAIIVPIFAALLSLVFVAIFYAVRRIMGWDIPADPDAFDSQVFLVKN